MNLRFRTIEIDKNTKAEDVNTELQSEFLQMYFMLDLGPNKKRLWLGFRDDIPEVKDIAKTETMQ